MYQHKKWIWCPLAHVHKNKDWKLQQPALASRSLLKSHQLNAAIGLTTSLSTCGQGTQHGKAQVSKKSFPFCLTDRLSLISLILPKSTGQPAAKWTCCCWNFTLSNSVRIEWMAILFPGRSRVNPPTSMKHLMGTQRQGRPTRYKGQSSCDSSYSFWVTHRELGRAQISLASGVALPLLWVLYLPGPRKVCTVWCKMNQIGNFQLYQFLFTGRTILDNTNTNEKALRASPCHTSSPLWWWAAPCPSARFPASWRKWLARSLSLAEMNNFHAIFRSRADTPFQWRDDNGLAASVASFRPRTQSSCWQLIWNLLLQQRAWHAITTMGVDDSLKSSWETHSTRSMETQEWRLNVSTYPSVWRDRACELLSTPCTLPPVVLGTCTKWMSWNE